MAERRDVGLQGRSDKIPDNPMRKSGSQITHQRNPILSGNGQTFYHCLVQKLDRGHMRQCDLGQKVAETDPEKATK